MAETTSHDADASPPTHALGVPSFRYLWFNSLSFYIVAGSLRFVYGWVVLDGLERGESWQGFVVFMLGVPSFFLLMPSGVWADRLDPKRMLLATQFALFIIMAGTAIIMGSGSGSLGLLITSAVLAGAATSFGGPVRSSLIPSLLKGDLLYSGIALNAIAITVSLVLGAVTAKIFGDWFGFSGAFWYLAALMAVGVLFLPGLESPGPATVGDKATMRQAMREGLSFVWNERGIRTLFALLCVSGLVMIPIMFVTTQAHIKGELGRTAGEAAPVIAMIGVGIAISSVYIMRRGTIENKGVAFMRAMMLASTTQVLLGLTTAYWQVMVLAVLMGMCGGVFINMNQGLIQSNTPADVMGRVMGLYGLVQTGLTPLGALILGLLSSAIGTGNAISLVAGAGLLTVVVIYVTGSAIREMT